MLRPFPCPSPPLGHPETSHLATGYQIIKTYQSWLPVLHPRSSSTCPFHLQISRLSHDNCTSETTGLRVLSSSGSLDRPGLTLRAYLALFSEIPMAVSLSTISPSTECLCNDISSGGYLLLFWYYLLGGVACETGRPGFSMSVSCFLQVIRFGQILRADPEQSIQSCS